MFLCPSQNWYVEKVHTPVLSSNLWGPGRLWACNLPYTIPLSTKSLHTLHTWVSTPFIKSLICLWYSGESLFDSDWGAFGYIKEWSSDGSLLCIWHSALLSLQVTTIPQWCLFLVFIVSKLSVLATFYKDLHWPSKDVRCLKAWKDNHTLVALCLTVKTLLIESKCFSWQFQCSVLKRNKEREREIWLLHFSGMAYRVTWL